MQRKKLIWHIYPPMVLVIIFAMAATSWYASSSLRDFFLEQTVDNLQIRSRFILQQLEAPFLQNNRDLLKRLCQTIGKEAATRITLISKSGEVVADSGERAAGMDNHADRLEVGQALGGRNGFSIRYSHTLRQKMLYVASPIYDKNSVAHQPEPAGIIRLAIPVTAIDKALHQVYVKILLSSIFLIIIAALITLAVSRRISRPIEKIRHSAERFSQGDLTRKIVFSRNKGISLEVGELAAAMNKMARQLDERIQTITAQRNELEAVFSSMTEVVLVVDMEERFQSANKAALGMFDIEEAELLGKSIVEVVRNPGLLKFIHKALAVAVPVEGDLVFHESGGELFFHGYGTALQDATGARVGCLVVLNDVTRLRRLERVRSDFVANVSHELKTPITTIKGFVETLKDGALADPVAAVRFIDIILKNSNRLNAIVDDLLALSRIEQEDENRKIELKSGPIRQVIAEAVESCTPKAEEKGQSLAVQCPDSLTAEINGPLLQQALVNLIVNAIKYSEPGAEIRVTGQQHNASLVIRVADSGIGIAQEHLPRLFERFYRSDRARSRKLGGTGLGLAIVKHIVHAHHGQVDVASTPGQGTVFTITMPLS